MGTFGLQFKHFQINFYFSAKNDMYELVANLEHWFILLLSTISLCIYIAERLYFILNFFQLLYL
jgi:hypothetical protein